VLKVLEDKEREEQANKIYPKKEHETGAFSAEKERRGKNPPQPQHRLKKATTGTSVMVKL